jgi:hypothetical protein
VIAVAAGYYHSLALVRDAFAPPVPPLIGRPPTGRTLTVGQSATLNAFAVGRWPMRYQWYQNGLLLAGQTNHWLTLTGMLPSQAGDYVLVAANDSGMTTSAVASITVKIPGPVLASPANATNGFRFSFISIRDVIYIVESRENVAAGPWTELERRIGIGGIEVVTDASPGSASRFYRVKALYAPPPEVSSISWSESAAHLRFATVSGAVYVVQYKQDLNDTVWLELSRQTGTGEVITLSDSAPAPSRFYRVRVE